MASDEANRTADQKILYQPYQEIVNKVHQQNCQHYGWNYSPLKPGSFGYDNLIYSIDAVKKLIFENKSEIKLDSVAAAIHDGWVVNYLYWRDSSPFLTDQKYKKPYSPLGDERRNKCASQTYSELDPTEKEKDQVLAEIILKLL